MDNKITIKFKKGDIFAVLLAVVLIVATVIALFSVPKGLDNIVTIKYDGLEVHKMYLNVDEVYTMKQEDFELLEGDLVVVVENGSVRVDEQTSRYDYCEIYGEASRKGTAIICAPNHVVITIEGYEDVGVDWPLTGGN